MDHLLQRTDRLHTLDRRVRERRLSLKIDVKAAVLVQLKFEGTHSFIQQSLIFDMRV